MIYKDLKNLQKGSNTDIENVYEVEAIKNSIKNILSTKTESVPGRPNFGSKLYLLVFEQLDSMTEDLAKRYTREALARFEDRINVIDVKTSKDEAFNRLIINVVFSYKTKDGNIQNDSTSISFNL